VASFTPRPLYPQVKSPLYPLDRRLGGPQSRSGRGDEEKSSQAPTRIYTRINFTFERKGLRVYQLIKYIIVVQELLQTTMNKCKSGPSVRFSSIAGWERGYQLTVKKTACYEMLHRALELAGSCEPGYERSGTIKGGKFLY
jgi:hypothetical protein